MDTIFVATTRRAVIRLPHVSNSMPFAIANDTTSFVNASIVVEYLEEGYTNESAGQHHKMFYQNFVQPKPLSEQSHRVCNP